MSSVLYALEDLCDEISTSITSPRLRIILRGIAGSLGRGGDRLRKIFLL